MLAYCRALEKEIAMEGEKWRGMEISTIFLGGGTPSVIPPKAMEKVLRTLTTSFNIQKDAEFTSEANPGTLREDWLECVQFYGLNRLSLGVQAAQDGLLLSLGRIHTFIQAQEAVHMARRAGIANLSVDLMFALPGQSLADYQESLEQVCELRPEHISAYSLIVEEGTPLYNKAETGQVQPPDDDAAADFYRLGLELLASKGYHQYEVSNFAREGFACRHNIGYWQGAYYLGLGVSAHSMLPPAEAAASAMYLRRANLNGMAAYVMALEAGDVPPRELTAISRKDAEFEAVMLGLRMNRGVDARAFEQRFGRTLDAAYGEALASLDRDGLGHWVSDTAYALTPWGLLVENEALMRFMNNP